MTVAIRPARPADAATLAGLYARQRAFLAPFEPTRADHFYTVVGQRARLADLSHRRDADAGDGFVITADGEPVGMISLSNIVRGVFQSANLGYWVAREHNGRGIATAAVGLVVGEAFGRLGLHRVEAGTLVGNAPSQRVLLHNGFRAIGLSRAYLDIDRAWRDHLLFARTIEDDQPAPAGAGDVRVRIDGRVFVAERNGRAVGRASLDATPVAHAVELTCAVDEAERRTRVGSALIEAAIGECRAAGVRRVSTLIDATELGALAFLQRHGFTAEGIARDATVRDGRPADAIVLALLT